MKTSSVPQTKATHQSRITNGVRLNAPRSTLHAHPPNPLPSPISHLPSSFPDESLLTKDEVARFCQVSTRCVEHWMQRGWLRYWKIGSRVRFRLSEVEQCLLKFCGKNH